MCSANAGSFKRGQSGNPVGARLGTTSDFFNVKERLRKSGFDLIASLIEMAENKDYQDNTRIKAHGLLLERVAPALRSIEHTGQVGTLFTLNIEHPTTLNALHPDKQSLQSEQND